MQESYTRAGSTANRLIGRSGNPTAGLRPRPAGTTPEAFVLTPLRCVLLWKRVGVSRWGG